ncbi:MAG: hypothetical protein ACI38U_03300 [Corynebacterium sp.]|uniref:hypothetical protein n=1 Tax=Corynebacterium sp. TaxID=1720 RepID=UPI003EFD4E56
MTKIHDADHRIDADGTEHLRLTFTPHRGPHLTFTHEDFDRMVRGHLARERVAYRRDLVGITPWKVRRDLYDGRWDTFGRRWASVMLSDYGPVTVIHEPMVDSVRRS